MSGSGVVGWWRKLTSGDPTPTQERTDASDSMNVFVVSGDRELSDSVGEVVDGEVLGLDFSRVQANGTSLFEGSIKCNLSGRFGFAGRALDPDANGAPESNQIACPQGDLQTGFEPHLIDPGTV